MGSLAIGQANVYGSFMTDEEKESKVWGTRLGQDSSGPRPHTGKLSLLTHQGPEVASRLVTHLTCDVLLSRSLILSFTSFISEVIL